MGSKEDIIKRMRVKWTSRDHARLRTVVTLIDTVTDEVYDLYFYRGELEINAPETYNRAFLEYIEGEAKLKLAETWNV